MTWNAWLLGRPLEPLTRWAVRRRRRRPPTCRVRLPVPTVGVGNLVVGGTGKTSLVIRLAEELLERGVQPGVVLRGYRARLPKVRSAEGRLWRFRLLEPGESATPDEIGDEAAMVRRRLPTVPLGIGHPKAWAARALVESTAPDVVLVDDAFQHRRLYCDRQLVLLDARQPFHNGHLLPAGRLREPPETLAEADWAVLTHADATNALETSHAQVAQWLPPERILYARHRPVRLRSGRDGCSLPLETLQGRQVWAVCGIGNPSAFRWTLEETLGADVRLRAYRDHYRYGPRDWPVLSRLARLRPIVTTEKDAIKWEGCAPFDYWVLEVRLEWWPKEPLLADFAPWFGWESDSFSSAESDGPRIGSSSG